MSLSCNNCGAPYQGSIPYWLDFVKCDHCGKAIQVPKMAPQVVVKVPENVADKVAASYSSSSGGRFENAGFGKFLARKGVTNFDPVSGALSMGNGQVVVTGEGSVSGDANLKRRVERWIFEYLHQ